MVSLSRTVRVVFNPDSGAASLSTNGFGGQPAMVGLGRYYEFVVCCEGEPDPATGYLLNIKDIDRAVRDTVAPIVARACECEPTRDPVTLAHELREAADGALGPRVTSLFWKLTPAYGVEATMDHATSVLVRQQFDFAASHRLHVASLSDEANRAVFGKCNNPSGHGHNYRVEVAVRVPVDGSGPSLAVIETLVDEELIERFDHTYLNTDTQEFGPGGVNPSVEHIARVSYGLLAGPVREFGGELAWVTVWETDRTSCTFPAG